MASTSDRNVAADRGRVLPTVTNQEVADDTINAHDVAALAHLLRALSMPAIRSALRELGYAYVGRLAEQCGLVRDELVSANGETLRVKFIVGTTTHKMQVIKKLRETLGLGLREAADLVTHGEVVVPDVVTGETLITAIKDACGSAEFT